MSGAVDNVGLQARLGPDRLAAIDLALNRRWTYAALDEDVARCASLLVWRGIVVGDRVGALARNRVELIVLHHACARIGAIFVPLNWRLSASELRDLVADAEPSILFGDDCLDAAGLDGARIDELASDMRRTSPLPLQPVNPDRPSLILYTSGTSGRPKGALLSERNIAATAHNFALLGEVQRTDAILCESPMFHVIGIVTSIRPFLQQGATLIVSEGFQPVRTLARMADPGLGVTHYFCVPQMASALRQQPGFDPTAMRGLKALFTGGAPHPEAAIRLWLDDGIPVVNGYGMSEAGTVFGMPIDPALIDAHAGSVGYAAPGVVTRIVDADDRDVDAGSPGELLIKGDNVGRGYWRRPEAALDAFTADGWFRTGDIVVADEAGCHRVVDRRKDMFISGGENVFPGQIEAELAHMPGVRECAVFGVPDERWGEVGHVAMVLEDGVTIDLAAIVAHLDGRLARYKLPRHLSLHDALPRTGSGKIQKGVLKERLSRTDANATVGPVRRHRRSTKSLPDPRKA